MSHRTIAIIGSAGRQEDASRVSRALYDAMYEEAKSAITEWGITAGESGGAALADHLCVRAFLEGAIGELTLFLPARFEDGRFVPNPKVQYNPGRTLNQYHGAFSAVCEIDSLTEIAEAIQRGAKIAVYEGFQRRNIEVAAACTHMLAFTFGADREAADLGPDEAGYMDPEAAGLKVTRGTAHTWQQCWRAEAKRHVSLTRLEKSLIGNIKPSKSSGR